MGKRLSSVVRRLAHDLELYATLAVCGLLLVLKILHVVEEHWVSSAILVTLMLLALGSLRDRSGDKALRQTLEKIASKPNDEGALRWYTRRSEATADMLLDMASFPHIAFLGISQRQLGGYLRERLQHATGPLPWETLEIYFAPRVLGEAYEGTDFQGRLLTARQEIAALLTDPACLSRLPKLRTVTFLQHDGFSTHTGSVFGLSPQQVSVLYAVHSAVRLHGDTHQGLTIRLSANHGPGPRDSRFEHYEGIYRALSQSAAGLGCFARSTWDLSAEQWSRYARQSDVLARSATIVAEMVSPQPGDSVLDIGSGSGDSARIILDRYPGASVTLLDGSPQMIRLMQARFGGESCIRFALCHLPSLDGSSIDLGEDRFAFIVIHQSLSDLMRSFGSLSGLATWCSRRLRPGGQIVVSAHNTVVATDRPNGFEGWKDPFRAQMVKLLKSKVRKWHLQDAPKPIAAEKIVAAFTSHGFNLDDHRREVIELSFDERRLLWHVPAVIESLVGDTMGFSRRDELDKIVDDTADSLRGQRTMPRTVLFWRFVAVAGRGALGQRGEAG